MHLQRFLLISLLIFVVSKQASVFAFEQEKNTPEEELRQQLYNRLAANQATEIRAKILEQNNFTEEDAKTFVDALMKEGGLQETLNGMAEASANLSNELKKSRIQLQEMTCRRNAERLLSYAQAQERSNPHLSHFINKEVEELDLVLKECRDLSCCCNNPHLAHSEYELFQKIESYFAPAR